MSLNLADLELLASVLPDLYRVDDPAAFPARVVAVLEALIPGTAHGYNDVDAVSGRLISTVEPAADITPELVAVLSSHLHEHPVVTHAAQTADSSVLTISDFINRDTFRRLAIYGEMYRHIAAEDQISFSLVRGSTIVGIAVNRDRWGFTDRDRQMLSLLRPHIATAHRQLAALTLARQAGAAAGFEHVEVSWDGTMLDASDGARQLLTAAFPTWRPSSRTCPPEVLAWMRTQASHLESETLASVQPLVVAWQDGRLIVRYAPPTAITGPALLLKYQSAGREPDMYRALGLSPREIEVLGLLESGASSAEIASALTVSRHTVNRHLQNVYAKLGVRNRTGALARLRAARNGS
jgi:DNA-binding CsgD family transcriptional regulator